MISIDGVFGGDIVQMIIHAGPVVKGVLFILLAFSVVSWAIIFMKWRLFRRAREENGYFLEMFWDNQAFHRLYNDSKDLAASPVAQLFRSAYTELQRLGKIQNPSTTKNGAPMLSMVDGRMGYRFAGGMVIRSGGSSGGSSSSGGGFSGGGGSSGGGGASGSW